MELILKRDVESLGHKNDVVKVANGYARNFLIPKGLAKEATGPNIKALEEEARRRSKQVERELHVSQKLSKKIEETSLTIAKSSGEEDKLFGSVTKEDIVNGLKEKGIEVDKKLLELEQPIKKLGIYTVKIKLHPEVEARLKVWVIKKDE